MERLFEDFTDQEELARLGPTAFRFWFGMTMTVFLAALLIYLAIQLPDLPAVTRALFLALGFGAGVMALWINRNGRQAIILTKSGLHDTHGREIAAIDNIRSVDRGYVIFKPSNGFVVYLKEPTTRAWEPGLWWRLGRRIGAGGTTPAAPAKDMADILNLLLKERAEMATASDTP